MSEHISEHAPDLDQVYVYHSVLDRGTWIPRTALRQHGLQGWIMTDPPEPPPPEVHELPEFAEDPPTEDESIDDAAGDEPADGARARGTNPEED